MIDNENVTIPDNVAFSVAVRKKVERTGCLSGSELHIGYSRQELADAIEYLRIKSARYIQREAAIQRVFGTENTE